MNPGTTAREERNAGVSESSAGRRGLVAVDDASPETGFSRTAPVHPGIHTQGQDRDEAKQKGQNGDHKARWRHSEYTLFLPFCHKILPHLTCVIYIRA